MSATLIIDTGESTTAAGAAWNRSNRVNDQPGNDNYKYARELQT